MKKGCELCRYPARIYCEADGASLCSDCDEKVHSANFLVAKHSRTLLCHACQSPTPWKASGTKLAPTVSVCVSCVDYYYCSTAKQRTSAAEETIEGQGGNEDDHTQDHRLEVEDDCSDGDEDGEYGDDGVDDDDDDEDEDEDGDNQVVPWFSTPPPPPVASSSSSEEVSSCRISALKRTRENADLDSEDEIDCTTLRFNHNTGNGSMAMTSDETKKEDDEATSLGSPRTLRPLKQRKRPNEDETESTSVAMNVRSLRKLQQNAISDNHDPSATILGICRLSRDPTAV